MIKKADPDMVVINEANDWDGDPPHRQIDTLAARLRGSYDLADADFTINRYHPRTGNYILYRTNMFRPLYQDNGKAHYWTVFHNNNDNMAMYQAFVDVQTGARFLVVAVHLVHGPNNAKSDADRRAETQHLLAHVHNLQARDARYADLPVILGGDFNSFAGHNPHNFDSPGDLLRRAHLTDSLMAAQRRTNTKFGSVNGYTPKPSHTGRIIDHFYGSAGVAFRTWTQVMNLRHGRWAGTIPSDHNPVLTGISIQD
jgi:endonuclease/exonuclease/phosphatase family metal-dependent hydrolase